jgi:choline dehydrogenase-like flavoprotein
MIVLSSDLSPHSLLRCDVCVIGAGAVGISLALALARSGLDVIVAEAGDRKPDAAIQDAYAGTVADEALHRPLIDYRERRLGGSTTVWGGRCMPLDAIDYEQRDWVPESGWPIGPEALAPFYPEANRLCEAGEFSYLASEALPADARPMIKGFAGTSFTTDRLERSSRPTDFAKAYGQELERAPNIRLLLRAPVTAIRLGEAGRHVASVDLRDAAGRPFTIAPREVVVANGGLETVRLLLASRDVHPHGIGNHHDVLGRYYQAHLAGTIGTVSFDPARTAIWNGYDRDAEGVYVRRRLALTEAAQREHRLGNFIARLHNPRIADPAHGTAILSALFLGQWLVPRLYRARLVGEEGAGIGAWARHAVNVARDPFSVAAFAARMLVGRQFAARKYPSLVVTPRTGLYSIDFHAEQFPNPASRVYLGTERDALGMPRLIADWRYLPQDVTNVQGALRLLARDLGASGLALDYDEGEVETEMTRYGAYPGHHIGLARMGGDPRSSMVDADCRIHGVGNLSLAGTAVFPTSSQANPTLTAIALALRLADRLAGEARGAAAIAKPAAGA